MTQLESTLEAVLFAAGDAVSLDRLCAALETPREDILAAAGALESLYDLENRGPGDFFGSAQHGLPTLRVADLVQDTRTLKVAQEEAKALLAVDPNLAMPQHRALSDEVDRLFATAGAMN